MLHNQLETKSMRPDVKTETSQINLNPNFATNSRITQCVFLIGARFLLVTFNFFNHLTLLNKSFNLLTECSVFRCKQKPKVEKFIAVAASHLWNICFLHFT